MSDEQKLIAGRYELQNLIGRGGMGDVYRALDTQTGEMVAIKALHENIVSDNPDIVDRFRREGEALRHLDHPNIVKLLDTIQEDERNYLVMEYVSGGSLRDLMDDQGQLPIDGVLNVALDLADALTRAHRMNVIHRDIKPDNVLLAEDGTPRLTDFGVAHVGGRTRLTETGSVIGTYAYLSPEACEGQELDERTDIWSFGIMLYEMIAGRPPFQAFGTAAILTAILTKPAPDLKRLRPSTPDVLVNLIRSMLEKDRNHRISSVRLVGAEVEAIIRGLDTPLRNVLREVGVGPIGPDRASRFATPSGEHERPARKHVPAMMSTPEGQFHGLSVYPTPDEPKVSTGAYPQMPMMTPGGTPITGEYPPGSNFRWVALIAVSLITAIAAVMIVAILNQPRDDSGDRQVVEPPPGDGVGVEGEQPVITVEPVEQGEYMVLIADIEALGNGTQRDVSRFLVDNLQQELEYGVPFSKARIRHYPDVIESAEEAQTVAAEYGATVIIWGHYNPSDIQLEVQVGVTTAFDSMAVDRADVEQVVNVRVRLTDEYSESVAQPVLGVLATLHGAAGNTYEFMRSLAVMAEIDTPDPEFVGSSVAAYAQRYYAGFDDRAQDEIDLIELAIDTDPTNPLLYALRSVALLRQGDVEAATRAAQTALRVGSYTWVVPYYLAAAGMDSADEMLEMFTTVVELHPDDWYGYSNRGAVYYLQGDYVQAWTDLEMAISLGPDANFPYALAGLTAIGLGDFGQAFAHVNTILAEFPDPDLYGRIAGATLGGNDRFGPLVSAFINMSLGRYENVLEATQTGLEQGSPVNEMYTMQGLAYCNLDQPAEAEAAYTRALDLTPEDDPSDTFTLLLRGDVRLKQGDTDGAQADFDAAASIGFLPPLFVDAFRAGQINCANFFEMFESSVTGEPVDATPAPAGVLPGSGEESAAGVEPVGPDEYMVLVAQFETLDTGDDDHGSAVTRGIEGDLKTELEELAPFSNIRVRAYPDVIASDAEAVAAAEETGAVVVIWGNTSAEFTEAEVQIGVTESFPYLTMDRRLLERTANVRVHLTDERNQSLAPQVLGVLEVLELADGDAYETMRTQAIKDVMDVTSGEIVGNTVSANMHRCTDLVLDDPVTALEYLDVALELDAGNPLLYAYRAMIMQRMGEFAQAIREVQSAERIGPKTWAMPVMLRANVTRGPNVASVFTRAIELRPNDWFPLFFRGTVYYSEDMHELAREDLHAAIDLEPNANFPYVFAALLAFHDGYLSDAGPAIQTLLQNFPDPFFMDRLIKATFGEALTNPYSTILSSFTYLSLGRYSEARDLAAQGLKDFPEARDLNLLRGIAECALGEYDRAENNLTRALNADNRYMLAWLMRADTHLSLGQKAAAELDLKAVEVADPDDVFAPYIEAVRARTLRCDTLFVPDNPIYQLPQSGSQEDEDVGEGSDGPDASAPLMVEPVEPDQIMILVADLEPLGSSAGQDVTRFVVDNLVLALEEEQPSSSFRVRHYPSVIASDAVARVAAEANGAAVIVWGNYTDNLIELEIQVGALDNFRYVPFERDMIERTVNVRVHLTDARQQSVAPQVAQLINLLTIVDGDEIGFFLTLAQAGMVQAETGEIIGNSVSAHMHRAVSLVSTDPDAAALALAEAIAKDGSNPVPYFYRALVSLSRMDMEQLVSDLEASRRLGPDNWTGPLALSSAVMNDFGDMMDLADTLIDLRPDDWYVWSSRALLGYYFAPQPDLTVVKADLERSMELHPELSTPYLYAALVALREGRIPEAQAYMHTILREHPDPQLLNRATRALYGVSQSDFRGFLVEHGTNLMLGRYNEAAQGIDLIRMMLAGAEMLGYVNPADDNTNDVVDLLLIGGLARCNLDDKDDAIALFSDALALEPSYTLFYLLRGQVRSAAGDEINAANDFAAAVTHRYGDAFDPWLIAAQSGEWTCVNFFDFQLAD